MANDAARPSLSSQDHPVSPDGPRRPALLVFDVNETLSDMAPMSGRFEDVGAPAHLAASWFAGLLRDGFARSNGPYPGHFRTPDHRARSLTDLADQLSALG